MSVLSRHLPATEIKSPSYLTSLWTVCTVFMLTFVSGCMYFVSFLCVSLINRLAAIRQLPYALFDIILIRSGIRNTFGIFVFSAECKFRVLLLNDFLFCRD